MAMLQVDPSQKKVVVALVAVLAAAVVFTIVRILPGDEAVQPAAQAAQTATTSAPTHAASDVECSPVRNPFERPAGIVKNACLSAASFPDTEVALGVRPMPYGRSEAPPGTMELPPMPVQRVEISPEPVKETATKPAAQKKENPGEKLVSGILFGGPDKPDAAQQANLQAQEKAERPAFKLMATIKSGGSYSAVLRTDDTHAWVVKVGDMIDGRYKVARIQNELAVLLDGRSVIIATRPRS